MNPALVLSAALAFVPTYAQDSDVPIDLDKIHGPVYVIKDQATGKTYVLVPDQGDSKAANDNAEKDDAKNDSSQEPPPKAPAKAWAPVRGVTYWA